MNMKICLLNGRSGIMALMLIAIASERSSAQSTDSLFTPEIPKTWDEEALKGLELPLADSAIEVEHASAAYYYSQPVRPIYRQYTVYAPSREPRGYFDSLKSKEPEIVFDRTKLKTKKDWINAGKLVFEAPIAWIPVPPTFRDPKLWDAEQAVLRDPITRDGILPFVKYAVRQKGKIELGIISCADCHTRVMPDGTVIVGAQGNRAINKILAGLIDVQVAQDLNEASVIRHGHMADYGAPWIEDNPNNEFLKMSMAELVEWHLAVPNAVMSRQGTSLFWPIQIPDLIGIKGRRYLDKTGVVRHRSIGDLMRYAALNQGMDYLTRYGKFVPAGINFFKDRPNVDDLPRIRGHSVPLGTRYSDEQLYALGLYLYSLEPPPNPNPFDELAARGKVVFSEEGCAKCHKPNQGYTNNKLVAASGYRVPDDHPDKENIMRQRVGMDPNSAMKTRRGTGLYKVPSLKGLWYRGPLEHNGSVATLEDWFDDKRLDDDYVPTGWKPPNVRTRAVPGHEYGLDLSIDEKTALIAFLKTL